MVICLKQQVSRTLLIIFILLLVYGISYYLSYIRYNDRDVTLLNALSVENSNLKKELNDMEAGLQLKSNNERVLMSRVIRRNIYNFYNEVVIVNNQESINVGDPVINGDGLIGIVSEALDNECIVKLLTGDYNISVKVGDSYGNLKNGIVSMLDKYKEIKVGDKVYTSGLTEIVGDIFVGEIEEVLMNEDGTAKMAKVNLLDNGYLNYVGVVKKS